MALIQKVGNFTDVPEMLLPAMFVKRCMDTGCGNKGSSVLTELRIISYFKICNVLRSKTMTQRETFQSTFTPPLAMHIQETTSKEESM